MAKCWTCGTHIERPQFNCTSCQKLQELKDMNKRVQAIESHAGDVSKKLYDMTQMQQEEFFHLQQGVDRMGESFFAGLSQVASAMEWGFGEIEWQLQQQHDVLRSIDHTLKTPSQTQGNEWRSIAEELRIRGVLDQSEEFYLKALEVNPLDYRIYIGLATTHLQNNRFDKAKIFLEKSLPHAPIEEIDYKSYSYRLIGHIYACEENYQQAFTTLQSSVELSPRYAEGLYDYAQYAALVSTSNESVNKLKQAIIEKSLYFYLAQHEKNFEPIRNDVKQILHEIQMIALQQANNAVHGSKNVLRTANETISKTKEFALMLGEKTPSLKSTRLYHEAETKIGSGIL